MSEIKFYGAKRACRAPKVTDTIQVTMREMKPDDFTLRFGEIAVKKGYVGISEVEEALKMQKRQEAKGLIHSPIGAILVDKGYMNNAQVENVLKEQWEKR
jgi:hypothetical protein